MPEKKKINEASLVDTSRKLENFFFPDEQQWRQTKSSSSLKLQYILLVAIVGKSFQQADYLTGTFFIVGGQIPLA